MTEDPLTTQVLEGIEELRASFDRTYDRFTREERDFAYRGGPDEAELLGWFMTAVAGQTRLAYDHVPEALRYAAARAVDILAIPELKRRVCIALQSAAGDAFEIAKTLGPLLVSLSAANAIQVPLQPIAISFISLLVARSGVATFCQDAATGPRRDRSRRNSRHRR